MLFLKSWLIFFKKINYLVSSGFSLAGNIIEVFNFTYLCNHRKWGTYYCKEDMTSNKWLKDKCLKTASQIMTKQAKEQAKKLE